MQLNSQTKKVIQITIAWTIVSLIHNMIGLGILLDMEYDFGAKDPWVFIKASFLTGPLAGVIGGSMMVFGWEKWLRSKPYGVALRNILLSYIIGYFVVSIPMSLFFNMNWTGLSITDSALWKEVYAAQTSPTVLVFFIFWMIIVALTMITFQVDDKYGPGVFKKFLLGKYFTPSKEERIFMFLDLRSSTSIAEKLGEETYFNFLRDAFRIVTPAIIQHKAEVYQYVGDEIILSWSVKQGLDKNHCIDCFFDAQKQLQNQMDFFNKEYNMVPEFKAGIHFGYVIAGEMGVIKREIAYSGDVLNTTARIQSKCNDFNVDLLISENLMQRLSLKEMTVKSIGKINLRGKSEALELYTVSKN